MLELYENIKIRREALGLTKVELANRMGYDRSMITKIEQGKVDLTQSKILAFAKALHTTPAYLMGWEKNLETDVSFIPQLMKDDNMIEHIKLLLNLNDSNKKSIFDMIDFLAQKEGL